MIPDSYYNQNACSSCDKCRGMGMIAYHFEQDTTRIFPCPRCFPENEVAMRGEQLWHDYMMPS